MLRKLKRKLTTVKYLDYNAATSSLSVVLGFAHVRQMFCNKINYSPHLNINLVQIH